MRDRVKYGIMLLAAVFLLASCEVEEDTGPVVVKPKPKPKPKIVEKEKELTEEEKRRIALQNMRAGRNPFKSYIIEGEDEDKGPLECCDITQFKVLAVIVGMTGGDKAKIQTPSGEKYTVKVGSRLGNRKGKIYKIADGTVYVKEKHKNVIGEEETVKVEIALPAN